MKRFLSVVSIYIAQSIYYKLAGRLKALLGGTCVPQLTICCKAEQAVASENGKFTVYTFIKFIR